MPEGNYFGLAVDIDTRVMAVWDMVFDCQPHVPELEDENVRAVLGAAVRTAYALGYGDALREDNQGRRASLHKANGYQPE